MKNYVWITSILLVLFFHCADRQRANPIDPYNRDTGGKPVGLHIYSEFDTIVLSWQRITVKRLKGYNIYRKLAGESSFTLIHLTSIDSTKFFDRKVAYDLYYRYRISVVTDDYESSLSDSIGIIPGPTNIWITDVDDRRIIEISHDGLHEIQRIPTDGYPWDVEIDPRNRSVWYSDVLWGAVYHRTNSDWKPFFSSDRIWQPKDIELDSKRNVLWAADENGQIIQIATDSEGELKIIRHEKIKTPQSLAVDPISGQCWVADPEARLVLQISHSGNRITEAQSNFFRPLAVAIDSRNGSCWVADSSRLVKLLSNGQPQLAVVDELKYAYALDVNQDTGEVWVVDIGNEPTLSKFDELGQRLLQVTGFTFPQAVTVNLHDDSCVIVDTGSGKVIRVSADGTVMSEIGGYYYPRGIMIEYAPEN